MEESAEEKPSPWDNISLLQPDTLQHQFLIPPKSIKEYEAQDRTPPWQRHCYEQFGLDILTTSNLSTKVPNAAAMQQCRIHIESLCGGIDWLKYLVWNAILEECYEAWAQNASSVQFSTSQLLQRILNGIGLCMNDRPSRSLGDPNLRELSSGGRVAQWLASQTELIYDADNPFLFATPGAVIEYLYRKGRPTNATVAAQLEYMVTEKEEEDTIATFASTTLTSMDRDMLAQLFQSNEEEEESDGVEYRVAVHDRNTYTLVIARKNLDEANSNNNWATLREQQLQQASWRQHNEHHRWLQAAKADLPGPVLAAAAASIPPDIPPELLPPTAPRRGRGRTIYYGTSESTGGGSPKQLQEAVMRWITEQNGPSTLLQCAEQLEVAPARIRGVIGKLLWQRRQLMERVVEIIVPNNNNNNDQAVPEDTKEDTDPVASYARSVHETEDRLRRLILKQLTVVPPQKLALAGDEQGASGADEDFSNAEWYETGHEWIDLLLLRPVVIEEESVLMRYQITAYTPAIIASSTSSDEGTTTARRPRFRAVPQEGPALLLTESQVWAGRHALLMNAKMKLVPGRTQMQSLRLHSGVAKTEATVVGHDTTSEGEHKVLLLMRGGTEASWATLNGNKCRLDERGVEYNVRLSDYDADSAAYQECVSILKYLQRQPKGKPFLFPVDPIALGIPQYRDIVKDPMDVSTVYQKLERGEYSNPPSVDNNPVVSMLQGPFRHDVELIFDNAMLFNPPDDWIHHAAAGLKKSVIQKIDQACRNFSTDQRSMYLEDEFSDDEHGSRKRKRRGGSTSREDTSSSVVAESIRLDTLKGRLPIAPKVDQFALASDRWLCRCKSQSALDELKALYQQRNEQRSRRAARTKQTESSQVGDLEFYTRENSMTATNRLQVEVKQESYHERMAQQYQPGTVAVYPTCLPPYLGRVLDGKWEIREERVIPALRWVLRGLAESEHVVIQDEEWVTPNTLYFADPTNYPAFALLDRKAKKAIEQESESDDDVALSEYEKARLERVARNNEKLRLLGLT